jgi:hypothetical protein
LAEVRAPAKVQRIRGLPTGSLDLLPVMLDVQLGRLRRMVRGVVLVALGSVSVVRGCFVVAGFVVPRSLAMMSSCVLVVFGCLVMVFCRLFGHLSSLEFREFSLGWHEVDCACLC